MSRGINKVILVGNVGREVQTSVTAQGTSVTRFSVATGESWKDKVSGVPQERTEWHQCAAFAKLADLCAQYLRTGSKIYCEGSLRTNKYEKDGQTHYATSIILSEVQFLDPRPEAPAPQQAPSTSPSPAQGQAYQHPPPPPQDPYNYDDDDIPF